MAELNRRALLAERELFKHHPARSRGAVAVSSPVTDYSEQPMDTYIRLVFSTDERGRSLHNLAEKLLAKKKDPKNKKFFDPVFLGRDGADAKAAKFLLWRTMFPPPEMVGTSAESAAPSILAESDPSESSTEPCPETSPTSSTDGEWESECDSPDSTQPSEPEQAEAPLPAWADLFTRESLSRDAAWALMNYQGSKTGKSKASAAPSAMAWEFALMLKDPEREKTFWQIIFKNAEKFDAQIEEERKKAEAERKKQLQKREDDDRDLSSVLERLQASNWGGGRPLPTDSEAPGGKSGVSQVGAA